jgi:hypothetical protein
MNDLHRAPAQVLKLRRGELLDALGLLDAHLCIAVGVQRLDPVT